MSERFRECERDQQVLATDLDGTFVPLSGNSRNQADLKTIAEKLRQHEITLTFVTGRHLESVQRAIVEHALPKPDWIICDVGTTIYENVGRNSFREVDSYRSHLDSIVATCPIAKLRELQASRIYPLLILRITGPPSLSYSRQAHTLTTTPMHDYHAYA